jgi:hypothetical protein
MFPHKLDISENPPVPRPPPSTIHTFACHPPSSFPLSFLSFISFLFGDIHNEFKMSGTGILASQGRFLPKKTKSTKFSEQMVQY